MKKNWKVELCSWCDNFFFTYFANAFTENESKTDVYKNSDSLQMGTLDKLRSKNEIKLEQILKNIER